MNKIYMREHYTLKDKFVVAMYYEFTGTWRLSNAMDKDEAQNLVNFYTQSIKKIRGECHV